jgi:hypothetical protein
MAKKGSDRQRSGGGGSRPEGTSEGERLAAWLEAPVGELAGSGEEIYRFTASEAIDGERVIILVVVAGDGSGSLLAEHRSPEGELTRFEETLPGDDVDQLREEAANEAVWVRHGEGADEADPETWQIDVTGGGETRSLTQKPPGSEEFRALGELFLDLAGLLEGEDGDIFDPESEESRDALEVLRELLLEVGYRAEEGGGEEAPLRVHLPGGPYPRLEPRFEETGGRAGLADHEEALILDVWAEGSQDGLTNELSRAPAVEGVTFVAGTGEVSHGGRHVGWFLVPLVGDDEGFLDFEALRQPLSSIRELLERVT